VDGEEVSTLRNNSESPFSVERHDMDRRTFLSLSLALPGLGQTAKPVPPGTKSKPAAPAGQPSKPVVPAAPAGVPWTQWGGPHRNFQTEATGLKDTWPAGGPPVIWKRQIGEGYSSPAVENGVLYTMYGKPRQEFVLAANAETGVSWSAMSWR